MKSTTTCLVSAKDYRLHWEGRTAPDHVPHVRPKYEGPERRKVGTDRRYFAAGGRRRMDRKTN